MNTTFKSTKYSLELSAALLVGLLVAGCGSKLERSSQARGGGGGNGSFGIARVPTCKTTEVLAMDGSMITLRTAYEGNAALALTVTLDGAPQIDLTNSNYAVSQCTTADKDKQVVTMTVPYSGMTIPKSVHLALQSDDRNSNSLSCGQQFIRAADPFANSQYVCQEAKKAGAGQIEAMVLMSTSQLGRLAKLTLSSSEIAAPQLTSYPAVVDFGDNSPKPFIIRPPGSSSISTVDKLYGDISDSNPSGDRVVRVVMYDRKGVRTLVQKSLTLGLYSNNPPRPIYSAENESGVLVAQPLIGFTEPKPVPPTNVVAVGYGAEDGATNPSGGSVVVYRLPSDGGNGSTPQRVLTIPNPFLSLPQNLQKLGTRVSLGDIDDSGNLSLVISQETNKHISVYNESTGQRLMPPVDLEDVFPNSNFGTGSNEAVALDPKSGKPQILVTNRSKSVYALKFDNIMGLTMAAPANATPFDSLGIIGEVRVAALGQTVVYAQSGRKDRSRFLRNGAAVTAEGNDSAGNEAWFSLGYHDPASKEMFAVVGKGATGEINVYQPQNLSNATKFTVFSRARGGVKTASADVNHDGISDILVAQGRDTGGTANQIAVVDGKSAKEGTLRVLYQFAPFANFKGGLYVSGHMPYRAP